MTISLVVITDGARLDSLQRTIDSAKPIVQEVIIVYQGKDESILEKIKAISTFAVMVKPKGNADPDRNYAYDLATGDWILSLDDDEILPKETAKLITRLVYSKVDVVWFRFQNLVDGVDIADILGPDPHPRLWRRRQGLILWPDRAHTFPQINSENHYISNDFPIIHDRKYEDVIKRHSVRGRVIDPQMQAVEQQFLTALKNKLGKK